MLKLLSVPGPANYKPSNVLLRNNQTTPLKGRKQYNMWHKSTLKFCALVQKKPGSISLIGNIAESPGTAGQDGCGQKVKKREKTDKPVTIYIFSF